MNNRILIIMQGYFPGKKYGGPPVSVNNFCSLIKEYDVYIVTKNHDLNTNIPYTTVTNGWNDRGNCKVLYLRDSDYNYLTFNKIYKELKPHIIYLQSFFESCVFPCLRLAKKNNVRLVIAPRGEVLSGALQYKKMLKGIYIKIFKLMDRGYSAFHVTSKEEENAIYSLFHKNRIYNISNISSIEFSDCAAEHIKSNNVTKLVYISRVCKKKNLLYIVEGLSKISNNVIFDIYGPIEDSDYWKECLMTKGKCENNIKINYCGELEHSNYKNIIKNYDYFILMTNSENYGHAIVESMISNCPVIISKNTTPWDSVNENGGFIIPLGEPQSFINMIKKICDMDNKHYQLIKQKLKEYVQKKLNVQSIKSDYLNMIDGDKK